MSEQGQLDYKKIGERIRIARLALGMSQADLANRAMLSLPRISYVEQGKVRMRLDTFARIAEALQSSADELLRLNVPRGQAFGKSEFEAVLDDCTPDEIEAILRIEGYHAGTKETIRRIKMPLTMM